MWPYHPDLIEKAVPRYTSYPTAADFGEIPTSALRDEIEQADGEISAEAAASWRNQLIAASEAGHFFSALTGFIVSGTKPCDGKSEQ